MKRFLSLLSVQRLNCKLAFLLGTTLLTAVAGAAPYQRWYFGEWSDDNHDGCNRRCEILSERSLIPPTYSTPKHTIVKTGYWADAYNLKVPIRDASEIDLDHVVPLALAWQWGADGWEKDALNAFYNDSENLASTTAHSNRSKGDKPPSKWAPTGEVERCFYFWRFNHVVEKYGLHIPAVEQAVLNSCLPPTPATSSGVWHAETATTTTRRNKSPKRRHADAAAKLQNPTGCKGHSS